MEQSFDPENKGCLNTPIIIRDVVDNITAFYVFSKFINNYDQTVSHPYAEIIQTIDNYDGDQEEIMDQLNLTSRQKRVMRKVMGYIIAWENDIIGGF